MLSLVKSFFGTNSESSSDEETDIFYASSTSKPKLGEKNDLNNISQASKSSGQNECDSKSLETLMPHTKNEKQLLLGSLYSVKGLQFECIMRKCVVSFRGLTLEFVETDSDATQLNMILFQTNRISMIRQHLPDGFQFLVRDISDGGQEYGFQLETPEAALNFRKCLLLSVLESCIPVVEIECALAEYDAVNKEFVIITKAALAQIMQRKSNDDYFILFSDSTENEKNVRIIFMECLTRDIQIWPSPQTYQITFWAIRFDRVENARIMFLMEADPHKVDQQNINQFFKTCAIVLQDKSFLPSTGVNSDQDKFDASHVDLMEDDNFVIELDKDEGLRRGFKGPKMSKFSIDDAASSISSDEDKGNCTYPRYTEETGEEHLFHRFMEVGKYRTFVCRGNQHYSQSYRKKQKNADKINMKVYKRDDEDSMLTIVGSIDGSKFSYDGHKFTPGMSLLHQQESKLLLGPEKNEKGDIYLMDMEREHVIHRWNAADTTIESLFPTTKQSQLTNDPTFLCTNSKSLFLMDTRLPQDSAKSTSFSYKTNPQISVGATDSSGHILLGSRLGELRLFDGKEGATSDNFKRAKTLLETIKEPIIAVDVTRDGSWILATTKTFLVTFPTKSSSTGKTGFELPLGQQKPNPRYLMLTAKDVVNFGITDISFAPAHFDAEEECIVTSTGNMAVVWDFESVKRGNPFYSVQFAQSAIKDVQIPIDSSDVVVAYPTAIGLFETEKKVV